MKQPISKWKITFLIIWAGQAFSLVGSSAVQFSLIWWLTVQTGSPITLTLASLAGFLPQALFGPVAGVWIDRLNRKLIMQAADLFIAAVSAVLMVAFLFGTPSVWMIYFVLFLRAVGSVFHAPAMQAAIPLLVPPEGLTKAGGWGQFIQSGALMAGPVLGAGLMAIFPMEWVILVDILGAILAVVSLLFVTIPNPPVSNQTLTLLQDIKQGIDIIQKNRPLLAVYLPILLCVIVYIPLGSLFPLMVKNQFGGGAWHSGVVEFVFAGGLLLSSVAIGLWGVGKRPFFMISIAITLLGGCILLSGLLPPSAFWGFVVISGLMGCTGNMFTVPFIAYIQSTVPPQSLGKVLSLVTSAMSWSTPAGLFIAGPAAQVLGVSGYFALSGGLMILVGFFCFFATRKYS